MRIGDLPDTPLFSCVSAAVGTGVQGGVINSTGSHGSGMDGAVGTTSAAGQSVTAAQSQSKPGIASGVVTVVSDATPGVVKPGTTAVQTLNGSTVVVNCHIPGGASADSSGHNSQPAVALVNNGPVSVSKGSTPVLSSAASTIIRTSSTSVQNAVVSSPSSVKSVPTVALVRPPMQTLTITSQSADNPTAVLTSPAVSVSSTTAGSLVNKTIIQTGGHIVASTVATGTTATMRSPTVLQSLRTSVPSTIAATPPGGIRAIAPQVLAPRLAQPQQNVQNIQLPPGNSLPSLQHLETFPYQVISTLNMCTFSCWSCVSDIVVNSRRADCVLTTDIRSEEKLHTSLKSQKTEGSQPIYPLSISI